MYNWAIVIYFVAVLGITFGIIAVSHLIGERNPARDKELPYEGGVLPSGSARVRMSAKFYIIAMFFLIFDLEAVFLYTWAVSAREVGWLGYFEALLFIAVLGAALLYLWRIGALDWAKVRRHTRY